MFNASRLCRIAGAALISALSMAASAAVVHYEIIFVQDPIGLQNGWPLRPAAGGFDLDEATGATSNISATIGAGNSGRPGQTYAAQSIGVIVDASGHAVDVVNAVPGNPGTPGTRLPVQPHVQVEPGVDWLELGVFDPSRTHVYVELNWSDAFNASALSYGTYSFNRIAPSVVPLPAPLCLLAPALVGLAVWRRPIA